MTKGISIVKHSSSLTTVHCLHFRNFHRLFCFWSWPQDGLPFAGRILLGQTGLDLAHVWHERRRGKLRTASCLSVLMVLSKIVKKSAVDCYMNMLTLKQGEALLY